eukprot:CAMPEP_0195044390 /NCGR_PEP_ID=MMETSP0347-20130606/8637_1 /TAXON_ID=2932 /ORGANISM="Alexandrium fundyense, Strain CCMP1719" /LENGTH=34 /DNA_ID= /DNA_START= /DNA_END= /DNA_ORIENTATION=
MLASLRASGAEEAIVKDFWMAEIDPEHGAALTHG